MTLFYLGRQSSWVPIKKCEAEMSIKKGSESPSIKCTHLPLILAWASTIDKVQDLSLEQGVIYLIWQNKNHLDHGKYILHSVG